MNKTFDRIIALVEKGDVRISDHGYDELANDELFARDIVDGVAIGIVVEDYPDYHKGPSVLVFQADGDGRPIHVVWGYREVNHHRRWLSLLIALNRSDGQRIF